MIDAIASERVRRFGIPECLRVPVAAVDEEAIGIYVGQVVRTLSGNGRRKAFLVEAHPPLPIDPTLPIWEDPGAAILHQPQQVWVHRDYGPYRRAYQRAFPEADLHG